MTAAGGAAALIGAALFALSAEAAPPTRVDSICASPGHAVREEAFVSLGGIEQWVTVQGANCANPVILVLHGGPGSPLSPYADALYGAWEKDFALVQWDQRGAGRTFGRSLPGESPLTLQIPHAAPGREAGHPAGGLVGLGPPPWENPRAFGVLRRATRAYEAKSSEPAPKAWWVPAPGYDTRERLAEAEEGEHYSYLQFVGRTGDGLFSKVDLAKLGTAFGIPVFFIHGAEDLVATPEVARRYFDAIAAPRKEFVLVPKAGHDPNPALLEAQHRVVTQRLPPAGK